MATHDDVDKVMVYLAALYPAFKLQPETVNAYFDILQDIDAGTLLLAARHVGSSSTFFPAASEIRRAAFEIANRATGAPSAGDAYAEVMGEVRRVGYCGIPVFSHPVIERAVEAIGGWYNLCMSDNQMADRAHFFRIYDDMLARERADAVMLPEVKLLIQRMAEGARVKLIERRATTKSKAQAEIDRDMEIMAAIAAGEFDFDGGNNGRDAS